jgi:hypothetical protein
LNDLLLKINNTLFQIDTLIIFQNTITFFEVKNYEGDFYLVADKFYTKSKSEIKNPLLQLKRSESLLRQLLQSLGFQIPIQAWVVFINPEFTLYQAPLSEPIIFHSQLHRYLKKLDMTPSKLNGMHKKLADQLISLHIEESPYKWLPSYDDQQLQKGITCAVCHSFLISVSGTKCVCDQCKHEEAVETAVLRIVEEFKLLFPDRKITTNVIYEWCKVIPSKRRISRILVKNFKAAGALKLTYYE